MNERHSPMPRAEDDSPSSPKRKKVRAKYAPRACVSCRRSKLKCSGENPCQRCIDNGKRCFYSEDQTAAEALQNLSRPTAVQPPFPQASVSANGNGLARRNILPRHGVAERRSSDASVLGLSMEARMARIEHLMEVLIHERERGVGSTPRGSIEQDDATVGEGLQAENAFRPPSADVFNPSLASIRQPAAYMHPSPPERTRHSISGASASSNAESMPSTVCAGARNLVFPGPADYQKYIDFFFNDMVSYCPCINEAEFRTRSDRMLTSTRVPLGETSLLALNYIMFACGDIAVNTTPTGSKGRPPGWPWFQVADELVSKQSLSACGDLTLVQFLVWQTNYLALADKPNAAYNIIGIACRLCFQLALHQQPSWANLTPFQTHMRQCVFWNVYVTDRCVSLSCGRPYNIRDLDMDLVQPTYVDDRDVQPNQPLPQPDPTRSSLVYLSCTIYWARLVGALWDHIFAAGVSKNLLDTENAPAVDADIKKFSDHILPTVPLIPPATQPDVRQLRQHVLVHTRVNSLRLLLRRQTMLTLTYDPQDGRLCGDMALSNLSLVRRHAQESRHPSSFRHHMAVVLAISLLILSSLLVRDLMPLGLNDMYAIYAKGWRDALAILSELATTLQLAKRMLDDFKDIVPLVTTVLKSDGPASVDETTRGVLNNAAELFPYREFAGAPSSQVQTSAAVGDSAPYTEMPPNHQSLADSWDTNPLAKESGHGVLWI